MQCGQVTLELGEEALEQSGALLAKRSSREEARLENFQARLELFQHGTRFELMFNVKTIPKYSTVHETLVVLSVSALRGTALYVFMV